ncbi:MAG: hypothetical protein J6K14_03200 [Clostridia bacterium]|nr:hypothetical protein [Clostridia bacterium]
MSEQVKKAKKTKKRKDTFQFKGHPILALVLLSVLFTVVAVVYSFAALIVGALIDSLFHNMLVTIIVVLVASVVAFFFVVGFFIYSDIPYWLLQELYGQKRTTYFSVYSVCLILVFGSLLIGGFSNLFEYDIFFGIFTNKTEAGLFALEQRLGFGILSFLYEAEGISAVNSPDMNYLFFVYSLAIVFQTIYCLPVFLEKTCIKCRRANIMSGKLRYGASYTRAEFSETSGHWTRETAAVQYGDERASVEYDQYVPGKTTFDGVYKYTDTTSTSTCPFCGRTKYKYWKSRSRIL